MGAAVRSVDGHVFTGVNLYHFQAFVSSRRPEGVRSVVIEDLLPLAAGWTVKDGSEMA